MSSCPSTALPEPSAFSPRARVPGATRGTRSVALELRKKSGFDPAPGTEPPTTAAVRIGIALRSQSFCDSCRGGAQARYGYNACGRSGGDCETPCEQAVKAIAEQAFENGPAARADEYAKLQACATGTRSGYRPGSERRLPRPGE